MPMRLRGTRARSWPPCTTKRPASTGVSPARLASTQSLTAIVSNTSALAVSAPAASPTRARTAVSFGGSRKWIETCQSPAVPSKAPMTACVASKLSPRTATKFRAVASLTVSRATTVASKGEGEGTRSLLPVTHRVLLTADGGCYPQTLPMPSTRVSTGFPQGSHSIFRAGGRRPVSNCASPPMVSGLVSVMAPPIVGGKYRRKDLMMKSRVFSLLAALPALSLVASPAGGRSRSRSSIAARPSP